MTSAADLARWGATIDAAGKRANLKELDLWGLDVAGEHPRRLALVYKDV